MRWCIRIGQDELPAICHTCFVILNITRIRIHWIVEDGRLLLSNRSRDSQAANHSPIEHKKGKCMVTKSRRDFLKISAGLADADGTGHDHAIAE